MLNILPLLDFWLVLTILIIICLFEIYCSFKIKIFKCKFWLYSGKNDKENFLEAQSGVLGKISENTEYIDLAFDIYTFYRDFSHEKSVSNWSYAMLRFVKNYYSFFEMYEVIHTILCESSSSVEAHSFDPASLRTLLNTWKQLSSSDLVVKTERVVHGLVACGLTKKFGLKFDKDGYHRFLGRHKKFYTFNNVNDMLFSVVDMIVAYAETGYECFVDKSIQPLLIQDRAVREWVETFQVLVKEIDDIPITEGFDQNVLFEKINSCLAHGNALMKTSPKIVTPLWRVLMDKHSRLTREYNVSSTRKSPFSVLIHGPPGIGKSTVTQLIGTIFHRTIQQQGYYDLDWDPKKNMYTYNSDDEYWSGYRGATQWFICMDDLARETKNHLKNNQSVSIRDVITIVNSVGIATTQAAIEDKGCIPLIPKLVVATTNTKDLNAQYAVAEKAAVLRRFPYVIRPHLKNEYIDMETGMMKKLDHVVYDAWTFEVETIKLEVVIENGQEKVVVHYVPLKEGYNRCTGQELSIFLHQAIMKHEESAVIMQDSLNISDSITMCEHGVLTHYQCDSCITSHGFGSLTIEEDSWFDSILYSMTWSFFRCLPFSWYWYLTKRLVSTPGGLKMFAKMGVYALKQRIPRSIRIIQSLFLTAAGSIAAYQLIKLFSNLFVCEKKENKETIFDPVEPLADVKENIWKRELENDKFLLPDYVKKNNLNDILNTIKKGMVRLNIGGDCPQAVSAFALRDGLFVTVNHAFQGNGPWKCVMTYGKDCSKAQAKNGFVLTKQSLTILSNDLVVFQSASILPRKNLFRFLPNEIDKAGRNGYVIGMLPDGSFNINEMYTTKIKHFKYASGYGYDIEGDFMDGYRIGRCGVKGDCGSIVISLSYKGYYISALHCAGQPRTSRCISSPLSKKLFENCQAILPLSGLDDESYFQEGGPLSGGTLNEPFYKGIHQWMDEGSAVVLGSYRGRMEPKSKTKETMICKSIEKSFDFRNKFCAPLMKAEKVDGLWKNPFTIAANEYASRSNLIVDEDILLCAQHFIRDTYEGRIGFCKMPWIFDTSTVSLGEAINGVPGEQFINGLPMSTSGGFKFPGPKRKYFDLDQEIYKPSQQVLDYVRKIENNYRMGNRACVVFQGTLKDEPIKEEKRISGKTRVFTACDVAFSIVVRKQYLRITKLIMENNFQTECAAGMNCYSNEWVNLFDYLCNNGENNIIAGDYKFYDKGMRSSFIRAAFWVLDTWRDHGQKRCFDDYMICQGIATDISFPVTNLNGDLFQFFGGNSSGHPLTVIINSIVNSLYIRFAYLKLNLNLNNFTKEVNLMTLGDDNIMSSRNPYFNHTSISEELAKYGITYTMADKSSLSVPFLHISEVDFLKRGFVRSKHGLACPLKMSSIFKSLCMFVEKGNISEEQQIAQSYLAARREWSLHGEDVFNECTLKMENIFNNFPRIKEFFIESHFYSYALTRSWVTGLPIRYFK